MEEAQKEALDKQFKEAREKLESEMDQAIQEHEAVLMRQGVCVVMFALTLKECKNHLIASLGVTLALAHSPRWVSKVSGEGKSSITRPFGEYDFRYQ